MLKRLVIENINAVKKCEIDFSKGNYKFGDENLLGSLVNPIAIYGHNGSGKSAALGAMGQLISLMSYPVENLGPFSVNNFLYEKYMTEKKKDISLITGSILLEFQIQEDEYEYYIATTSLGNISKEYLIKNKEIYFDRSEQEYSYGKKERENVINSPLVPLLRILASSEINDATIQVVFAYISSFTFVNLPRMNSGAFVVSRLFTNTNINDLLVAKSNEVKDLLASYDDFPKYSIIKKNVVAPNGLFLGSQYGLVLEDHSFKKELPLNMISTGMRNQSLLLSILLSIPESSILFIDEADYALHATALKSFLDVIREKKIQVVFSLHNTYALQLLRPDQVYFAKWSKGFSKYCRLSKIYPNIREVNNIEKMYLSSLFDEAIDNHE